MKVYVRRIDQQCLDKQVSITIEVLNNIFNNVEKFNAVGKLSRYEEEVKILPSTDNRFNAGINHVLDEEAKAIGTEPEVGDFMVMYQDKSDKNKYIVELVKSGNALFNFFYDLYLTHKKDRHIIIYPSFYSPAPKLDYPRNRIIFGAPGTGKSYKLNEESNISFKKDNIERVTFHPDYIYANFVGSYKPTKVGTDITYEFVPGPFIRTLKNALDTPNENFLLIIEEINRADTAAVFGDVFQLLDRDKDGASKYPINISEELKNYFISKGITLDILSIPSNIYIWATMNSADQGVFPMDTAFRRRWEFEYIGINSNESVIDKYEVTLKSGTIKWNDLRKSINNKMTDLGINEDKLLGPFFINFDDIPKSGPSNEILDPTEFIRLFKDKIIMYLFEDACKQCRPDIFKEKLYSEICKDFEDNGIIAFKL